MALKIPAYLSENYKDPIPLSISSDVKSFNKPNAVTLEDCLNLFITTEKLGDSNAW